jgi:uncharacterized low-complexity protein
MGSKKKNLTLALGAAAALSLAASPAFSGTSSPFQMQSLPHGYLVAKAETKPSTETKPATETMKSTETKAKDSHCGSKKSKDGHCGEGKSSTEKKAKDGHCGEGTCGSNKK